MAAYLVCDIEILDPIKYQKYIELTQVSFEKYGAKLLSAGSQNPTGYNFEIIENQLNWEAKRISLIQFENMDSLKAWYNSPEYSEAKKLRLECAKSSLLAVDGASKN